MIFFFSFFISNLLFASPTPPLPPEVSADVKLWCNSIQQSIKEFRWELEPCKDIRWKVERFSVKGHPIVYAEFGDTKATNTTLVFSMVHGDEITPLFLALKLAIWLKKTEADLNNVHVVVVPLVNPDGFYHKPRTRTNANGVDLNRNLVTDESQEIRTKKWVQTRKDPRRYPGKTPGSEPETQSQQDLIALFDPSKIVAIHSPLKFWDIDGPNLTLDQYAKSFEELRKKLNAKSRGFFPGSLGNYGGRKLGIPTITLELPSADPRKAKSYWETFSQGLRTMIEFNIPRLSGKQK